jgi:hypothetical protein
MIAGGWKVVLDSRGLAPYGRGGAGETTAAVRLVLGQSPRPEFELVHRAIALAPRFSILVSEWLKLLVPETALDMPA